MEAQIETGYHLLTCNWKDSFKSVLENARAGRAKEIMKDVNENNWQYNAVLVPLGKKEISVQPLPDLESMMIRGEFNKMSEYYPWNYETVEIMNETMMVKRETETETCRVVHCPLIDTKVNSYSCTGTTKQGKIIIIKPA